MKNIAMYSVIALLCLAMAGGVFLGGPPSTPQRGGGAAAEAAVADLTAADIGKLNRQREVAKSLFVRVGGDAAALETATGKVAAIQTVLDKAEGKNSVWELQCLGVQFGDALVQAAGVKWIVRNDGSRRIPGLVLAGTEASFFPIGLFVDAQKSGEALDANQIFESLTGQLIDLKSGKKKE
jgi:hypothetical protein